MTTPFEISFHHFEGTERIRERIAEHIDQLGKFERDLTSGRVVVDGTHRHGHKTEVEIRVELNYPGGKAVGKRSGEFPSPAGQRQFDTALAQAFATAEDQVRTHFAKRQPQETKQLDHQPTLGRIARLDDVLKNGFIALASGDSLFFAKDVVRGDFDALAVGDEVMVTAAETESAYGPQAAFVKPIGVME